MSTTLLKFPIKETWEKEDMASCWLWPSTLLIKVTLLSNLAVGGHCAEADDQRTEEEKGGADEWMEVSMDGWIDRWVHGRMDELMDE